MSLNVGELVAFLRLDDRQFDEAMAAAPAKAQKAGDATQKALGKAETAADGAGKAVAGAGGKLDAYGRQATSASTATSRLGVASGNAGKAIGTLAGLFAGAKLVDYIGDSITAADGLNQVIGKSGQIFGSASAQVERWSETAVDAVGLSKRAALDAATGFGNMFTQIGFTSEAAGDLSTKVVQLAADQGAFNNLPTGAVIDKISGALRGEYDSLQALIPNINAARVEQEALAATGKSSADALTAQERAQATLAIIMRDGATATGQFARESESFAVQSQKAAAAVEEQKAALGDRLMPVVKTLMDVFQNVGIPAIEGFGNVLGGVAMFAMPVIEALGSILSWFTQLPGPIQTAVVAFTAFTLLKGPMGGIEQGLVGLSAKAKTFGATLKGVFLGNPIGLALTVIATGFSLLSDSASEAEAPISDFTAAIDEQTGALRENAQELLAKSLADSGSLKAAEAAGISAETYVRALLGQADAIAEVNRVTAAGAADQQRVADAQAQASVGMEGGIVLLGEYAAGTEEALALQSKFAADTKGLAGAQDKARLAIEGSGGAIGDQAAETEDAIPAAEKLTDAAGRQEQANKDLEDAIRNVIAALEEQSGVQNPETQYATEAAIRAVGAAWRDQGAALRDIDAANAEATAAQDELNKMQDAGITSGAEYEAAQRKVADANDRVKDAQDRSAGSAADLYKVGEDVKESYIRQAQEAYNNAVATGNAAGAQEAARQKVQDLTQSLYDQMIQSGATDEEARAYIASLNLVPAEVATQVALNGADTGITAIDNLLKKLREIDGSNYSTTVTINQKVNAIASAATSLVTDAIFRAEGGHVSGPGTATSDSINARLSNGEHVFDAGDVNRLGGQAETYRFRNILDSMGREAAGRYLLGLPGFAAGGAVVASSTNGQGSASARVSNSSTYNVYVTSASGDVAPEKIVAALREYERTRAF